METPRFPRVAIDVSEDDADFASSELWDLGATGVEERDATTLHKGEAGRVTLIASFDDDAAAEAAKATLPAAWSPRLDAIVGDAWRDEYKRYFHPFLLCPGLVVRPPWEEHAPKPGEQVLVLEPGRAFGTGLHETTSLVAEILAERAAELAGLTLLDVGTGSGILALAGLILGAERARAIDVDADAVAVAIENAARNGLSARCDADTSDLASLDDRYGFVVANIEAIVLEPMAEGLSRVAAPGAWVVLSGILAPPASDTQVASVRAAYGRFEHVETKTRGEWAAIVLRAPREPR